MRLRPDDTVTPEDLARGRRALVRDAAWATTAGSLYGGVILVGFALELGASPFIIGLLAAIPFLAGNPRFRAPNLAANLGLTDGFRRLAAEMGTRAASLAIGWLLARGPAVIPIPGTRSVAHLRDVLPAEDSAVVADEHDHRRPRAPQVAEAHGPPLGVGEDDVGEGAREAQSAGPDRHVEPHRRDLPEQALLDPPMRIVDRRCIREGAPRVEREQGPRAPRPVEVVRDLLEPFGHGPARERIVDVASAIVDVVIEQVLMRELDAKPDLHEPVTAPPRTA